MDSNENRFVQVRGTHFEKDGKPIVLRGWSLGSWMNFEHFMMGIPGTNSMILQSFEEVYGKENAAVLADSLIRNMVREEDIAYLKSIGANTVRIVLGYHWFWDDDNPGVLLSAGTGYLDRVIRFCEDCGMYCILDLHSVPGSQNTDWHSDNPTGQELFWKYRCFQDQVLWFWEEIAARYKDNPRVVGYDVLNEPGFTVTGEQIRSFYSRVITAIRRHDRNHIIFLEGTDFGRDFSLLEEPSDPQTALAVHFYPYVLDKDVLDPSMDDRIRVKIFTEIFEKQLSETAALGRPIWCGESGYEIQDDREDFYALLLSHNIRLCEERGISWSLWTYKDNRRMGIVIPKKTSPWHLFTQKIAKSWSHDWEQLVSRKITEEIGEQFYEPLDVKLSYELDFRVRSILHRIAAEQILKPALAEIPFEDMKTCPESFLLENCDRRETVIATVKSLTGGEDGQS